MGVFDNLRTALEYDVGLNLTDFGLDKHPYQLAVDYFNATAHNYSEQVKIFDEYRANQVDQFLQIFSDVVGVEIPDKESFTNGSVAFTYEDLVERV